MVASAGVAGGVAGGVAPDGIPCAGVPTPPDVADGEPAETASASESLGSELHAAHRPSRIGVMEERHQLTLASFIGSRLARFPHPPQ